MTDPSIKVFLDHYTLYDQVQKYSNEIVESFVEYLDKTCTRNEVVMPRDSVVGIDDVLLENELDDFDSVVGIDDVLLENELDDFKEDNDKDSDEDYMVNTDSLSEYSIAQRMKRKSKRKRT